MRHILRYLMVSSLVLSFFSRADERLGISQYMGNSVPIGHIVCEPLDASGQAESCFFLNDFSRTIVPQNDTSGVMAARSVSDKQGAFVEVKLDQLATSVHPDRFKSSHIFDFYLKLHWKGERPGALNVNLEGNHVIRGQVVRGAEGDLDIKIESVPSLFVLSMFMPGLDVAEMFGRNVVSEANELEYDVKLWMALLIGPVLKSYFSDGAPAQINLP
jgi:hypothetical protein